MNEISLSELIVRTEKSVLQMGHSQSTQYQYQMGWRELADYFCTHNQVLFCKSLAEQYLHELKARLDARIIKKWHYKLMRRTTLMTIECYEEGFVTWKYYKDSQMSHLHQTTYVLLLKDYRDFLKKVGKSSRTIEYYELFARQFLEYLEQKKIYEINLLKLQDVSLFIPFISKYFQPTSMRTVFSAIRSFLQYVENKHLTELQLRNAFPNSLGRKTEVITTLTPEEEQKLLSCDCKTSVGKRNNAMLLLALRTGLRSIDIVNLKLSDIHWKNNTIEIVQEKTGIPLILPLLAEVGNAIADYILYGRPPSELPYIFLRSLAPHRKLAGRASCYGISCKLMKAAGIRQTNNDRKGFHILRHSLAAKLLSKETPLPIISSILGHRDKDSTMIYLSTDLVHLRTCALGLFGIETAREELK